MSEIVDQVYAISEKFQQTSAADLPNEASSFQFLLDTVKTEGTEIKVKALAAGLIPQYAANFPELIKAAADVQLDLCEDDEVAVRIAAIRGLSKLVESLKDAVDVDRVVDAIIQLMLTVEDKTEEVSLTHVYKQLLGPFAVVAFKCILAQYQSQTEEAARAKLSALLTEDFSRTAANYKEMSKHKLEFHAVIKAILTSATLSAKEFSFFIQLLSLYSSASGVDNASAIAELYLARAELSTPIPSTETEVETQLSNTLAMLVSYQGNAHKVSKQQKDNQTPVVGVASIFSYFFDTFTPFVVSGAAGSSLPVVGKLASTIAGLVELLTLRQGNAVFEAVLTNLKTLLDSEQPNAQLLVAYLLMFSHLASYLPDQVHERTGLPVKTIQPSMASADTIEQRRVVFVASVQKHLDAYMAQNKVDNEEISSINRRQRETSFAKIAVSKKAAKEEAGLKALRESTKEAARAMGKSADEATVLAEQAVARFQEAAAAAPAEAIEAEAEAEADAEAADTDAPKRVRAVKYDTDEEAEAAGVTKRDLQNRRDATNVVVFLLKSIVDKVITSPFVTLNGYREFKNKSRGGDRKPKTNTDPKVNTNNNRPPNPKNAGKGNEKRKFSSEGRSDNNNKRSRPAQDHNRRSDDRRPAQNDRRPAQNDRRPAQNDRRSDDRRPAQNDRRGNDRRGDDRRGGDRNQRGSNKGGDRRRDDSRSRK